MASTHSHAGPMSLENSKYASYMSNKAHLASFSVNPAPKVATLRTETAMAPSEHVAVAHHSTTTKVTNPDTQLAIAHGTALKDEVDKHAARFAAVIATAVANTRRLLDLIREVLPDSSKSTVDALWKELNELYAAVNDAKVALPVFLEKQRNNISLYHTSLTNQVVQDTQNELNIQHKKVNLQHSLILEHQEAFQVYKEQNAAKLKDLEALNDRVSRLTLEKGNLRTEVESFNQLLGKERAIKDKALSKVNTLQKEIETLVSSNKRFQAELDTLRKNQDDRPNQMKLIQQEVEQRFTTQLKAATDKLEDETKKTAALQATITTLGEFERIAKLEAENVKNENKALSAKYEKQVAEYARAFTKLNENIKEIKDLQANVERLQQQKIKLADVEAQLTQLTNANSGLTTDVRSLTGELNAARDEATKAKTERDDLLKKVETLSKDTASADPDTSRLIQEKTDKIKALQDTLLEWTDLAKRSYDEYKALLPMSKEAEQLRQIVAQKDEIIKDLQEKVASSTGSASIDSVRYWKNKYEDLLDKVAQ